MGMGNWGHGGCVGLRSQGLYMCAHSRVCCVVIENKNKKCFSRNKYRSSYLTKTNSSRVEISYC